MHKENTGALAGEVAVKGKIALQRSVVLFVVHGLSLELRCGRADLQTGGTYKNSDETHLTTFFHMTSRLRRTSSATSSVRDRTSPAYRYSTATFCPLCSQARAEPAAMTRNA